MQQRLGFLLFRWHINRLFLLSESMKPVCETCAVCLEPVGHRAPMRLKQMPSENSFQTAFDFGCPTVQRTTLARMTTRTWNEPA